MSNKVFRILMTCVGAGIVLGCTLDIRAQQRTIGPGGSYLLAGARKGVSEPARYRVYALKRISVEQGMKYLHDAKVGTVSRLPGVNMLLVSAQRRELNKASAILNLVDSSEGYVVKKLSPATQVAVLPSVEQIADAVGDITIGTFSNPPSNKTKRRAIVDMHDGSVIAIAPAGLLEEIVSAMDEFRASPEDVKVKTLQLEPPQEVSDPGEEVSKQTSDSTYEQPDVKPSAEPNVDEMLEAELKKLEAASEPVGTIETIEDNNDKLFSELLDSLAEAEEKLARQTGPPSEITEAMESLLTVGEPNEPGADITSESETQAEPNYIDVFPQPTAPNTPDVIWSQTREGPPETAEEPNVALVSNVFHDAGLREALSDISAQTGVIIVPDMTVTGMVTCELQDVPLEEALEIVLAGSDYVVKEMDGYYQVGSPDANGADFSSLSVTRTVKLNYLRAEDAKALLPETFADYVQVNKSGNEVCVTAMPAVAEKILRRLKDADKPSRQVMLEARVVELNADAKDKLGVDWSWSRQGHSPGLDVRRGDAAFKKTSAAIEVGYVPTIERTDNLIQALTNLCEDGSAKILANPRVTAMDGEQAKIEVVTEEYFKVTNGPARDAYASLETVKSGIMLQMTPRIGTGDEITLEVSPEVSDVVGVGAEGLPRVARRKVSTTVRVKNGGTVVIGGLANNNKQETSNKVPVLGGVPVLGSLFKGTTSTQTTRDVVIFITPRLLGEDGRPEQITNTMVDGPEPEPIEPADEELKSRLLEVLDP